MLVDEARLILRAGHGGPGKVSFFPAAKAGPDGGNGGKGGDVYISTTSDLSVLKRFTTIRVLFAEDGQPGQSNRCFGRDGKDLEVVIPTGSVLINEDTNEEINLDTPQARILICQGGKGGRGNAQLSSSRRTTPKFAQPGLAGEEKKFKISLKLIAAFGLIGLPNSGKSSLLNELTNANVKTANYPFTTLEPNLGVFEGVTVADIPGLIEGASLGKGLGHRFLQHIEKTKVLLHTIASDIPDPITAYRTVRSELKAYNSELTRKKEFIILTKTDMLNPQEVAEKLKTLKILKKGVILSSIYDLDSITQIRKLLKQEA